MSEGEFAGRRAVVTGGNRGMGLGIATRLAEQGAEVCLVARDEAALQEARAEVVSTGASCTTIAADLAALDEVTAVAEQLAGTGRWDILVNDAGNPPGPLLLDLPIELWDETFGVHVRAPFLLAKAVVPQMIERGGGDILSISSTATVVPTAGHGAYSPAKSALESLTRNMALEWGPHNIKANAIQPTAVMTKLGEEVWGSKPVQAEWLRGKIPMGRFGEVSDIVDLAHFLLGPHNSFVSGAVIPCDGAMRTGYNDKPRQP